MIPRNSEQFGLLLTSDITRQLWCVLPISLAAGPVIEQALLRTGPENGGALPRTAGGSMALEILVGEKSGPTAEAEVVTLGVQHLAYQLARLAGVLERGLPGAGAAHRLHTGRLSSTAQRLPSFRLLVSHSCLVFFFSRLFWRFFLTRFPFSVFLYFSLLVI